jgi:hypothetical protein
MIFDKANQKINKDPDWLLIIAYGLSLTSYLCGFIAFDRFIEGDILWSMVFLFLLPIGIYLSVRYTRWWMIQKGAEEEYNLIQEIIGAIFLPPGLIVVIILRLLKRD